MARHGTARHDKIFFSGFDVPESTIAGHRQVTTKTDKDNVVSTGIKEYSACLLAAGRCECKLVFIASCRILWISLYSHILHLLSRYSTVGYATTNDATTNEWYNEQFLSIKSGRYNERGGILFIMESSITVFTRERLFIPFMSVGLLMLFTGESLFTVFTKERLFILFKFTCTV
jgi:hypothetical protein